MPADTVQYVEARLDLPGDQRQKLGEFLAKAIPGFDDQAQLEPKLEDVLDRLVRSATDGKQTWTAEHRAVVRWTARRRNRCSERWPR